MVIKIINAALILVAIFMGLKQGWAMFTGKPEMIEMFGKWSIGKTGLMMIGAITILSAILVVFPKTFFPYLFFIA